MMKRLSEEQELREGLDKAIKDNDGHMAHYYGSQLYSITNAKRSVKDMEDNFEDMRERCRMDNVVKSAGYKAEMDRSYNMMKNIYDKKIKRWNLYKNIFLWMGIVGGVCLWFSILMIVIHLIK